MSSINNQQPTNPGLNEEGMASILVTLIMSVVITLIVLGFAQVTTREQSNALQNQLSTTAYYAAETGVNDAINIIQENLKNHPNYPASYYAKNTCGAPGPGVAGPDNGILYSSLYTTDTFSGDNSQSGATYSCLLVNPAPSEIVTTVGTNPQVIPINTGEVTKAINLTWKSTQAWDATKCNLGADPEFTTTSNWQCELSALRIDLVTVPAGTINVNNLTSDTNEAFIMPFNVATASCYGNISLGGIVCNNIYGASCSATSTSQGCDVNILLPNPSASTVYYLQVSSIYGSSSTFAVSGYANVPIPGNPNPQPQPLNGAEYIIDSTGLTHGVSKRIQVAVPILQSVNIPGYAIQTTDDLCKRFYIVPTKAYDSNGTPEGIPQSAVGELPGITSATLTGDCGSGY
jgi:Tfp pilus assembly protein PilX